MAGIEGFSEEAGDLPQQFSAFRSSATEVSAPANAIHSAAQIVRARHPSRFTDIRLSDSRVLIC